MEWDYKVIELFKRLACSAEIKVKIQSCQCAKLKKKYTL